MTSSAAFGAALARVASGLEPTREGHSSPARQAEVARRVLEDVALLDSLHRMELSGRRPASTASVEGPFAWLFGTSRRRASYKLKLAELREALARRVPESLLAVGPSRGPAAEGSAADHRLEEYADWTIDLAPVRAAIRAICGVLHADRDASGGLSLLHEQLLRYRLRRGPRGLWAARIDEAARRRHGVFYTPQSVVRYIVDRVFGGPVAADANHPPVGDGAKRSIVLDPACGCGPFLVEAARRIAAARSAQNRNAPTWRDMAAAIASLRGIDIDATAVLTARRVLWLGAIGRRPSGAAAVRRASNEAGGPSNAPDALGRLLAENIVCADALSVEPETLWNDPVDAVIGNPPYRKERYHGAAMQALARSATVGRHRTARMDLWYYFVHRALEWLAPGGRMSFIVGAYWTAGAGATGLIEHIRRDARIEEVFVLDKTPIFPRVAGKHMILTLRRRGAEPDDRASAAGDEPPTIRIKRVESAADSSSGRGGPRPAIDAILVDHAGVRSYEKRPEDVFHATGLDLDPPDDRPQLDALPGVRPLGELGAVRQGIVENPAQITRRVAAQSGGVYRKDEGVFSLSPSELDALNLSPGEQHLVRPYHDLCDVGRYDLAPRASRRLLYLTAQTCPDIEAFPAIRRHLERFRPLMEARRETRLARRRWWQLHWPRDASLWTAPKLIIVQMAARPWSVPAQGPAYVPFSCNVFVPRPDVREHLFYFAAVFNSRLMERWLRRRAKHRGAGLDLSVRVLRAVPIRRVDFDCSAERRLHDAIVDRVGRLLQLARARRDGPSVSESEPIREADGFMRLDQSIDALVDRLYEVESHRL